MGAGGESVFAATSRRQDAKLGRWTVLAAALLAACFVAGAFLIPWLEARDIRSATVFRLLYAPLCHQLPSRCIDVAARPVAVCARCTGLYLGGCLGLLVSLAIVGRGKGPRAVWLAVAVAPSLVDYALPWLGLPALDNLPRLLLALPAGVAAGVFLSIGLFDLVTTRQGMRRERPGGPGSVVEGWDG